MTIKIMIGDKGFELTPLEAERIYTELHSIFGKGPTSRHLYPPVDSSLKRVLKADNVFVNFTVGKYIVPPDLVEDIGKYTAKALS